MKFGHFALPSYFAELDGDHGAYLRRLIDFGVASEELGFDYVWANEHHYTPFGGSIPSTPIFLAAVSQRTSRVRLGTSIVVLPLHNPLEVAEQLAMVDLMSGGRVELGIGRGYVPRDYEVLGIPFTEGQERTLEGLEVILAAWRGEPLDHSGRYYRFQGVDVWPKPQQKPHPPVWMAASRNPQSFEMIARNGYRLLAIGHVQPMDTLAGLTAIYREAWVAHGRDPAACDIGIHFEAVVDEDGERARELAREIIGRVREMSSAIGPSSVRGAYAQSAHPTVDQELAEGRIIAGSPEECVEAIASLQDTLGLTLVNVKFLYGGIDPERAKRGLHLFAERVIPALKDRQPSPLAVTAAI